MQADMEAMKEQMTIMMEAMMSMKRMIEVNAARVVAASTATELDPTHPPSFNQVQSKDSFPPYGLPPNYMPPNVAHTPIENVDNSAPIPIESQHPQSGHAQVSQPIGETHEAPRDHNLVDSEPHVGYATKGWRDLAAQVAPPMMEREMITMIVDTLPVFYSEKMVGYMPSSFANLVFIGERIEVGLRRGKFDYPALMNRKPGANGENKKERETHVVAD
ncbi:hypothetical protein HKD37_04G010623 [Glycine soja]|nr:hypothetical protein GmHk_04G010748 [Glycine max]